MENLDLPILQICNSGTLFPLQTAHASRVVLRVVVAAKLVTRESDQKIYVAMYSSQAVHGTMGILHNHPKAYICLYIYVYLNSCVLFSCVHTYVHTSYQKYFAFHCISLPNHLNSCWVIPYSSVPLSLLQSHGLMLARDDIGSTKVFPLSSVTETSMAPKWRNECCTKMEVQFTKQIMGI